MIPAHIDYQAIVQELNGWGYGCFKIDTICGFSEGYTVKILNGAFENMTYPRAARLYNFWWEERQLRGLHVFTTVLPLLPEKLQVLAATT